MGDKYSGKKIIDDRYSGKRLIGDRYSGRRLSLVIYIVVGGYHR